MNHKIIIAAGLMFFSAFNVNADPKKQKVYSIVKTHHSIEWYQEQLGLWEKDVKENPKNSAAWLNVYTAARMIKISGGSKTQEDLDAIVEQVKKNVPDTFEGNYIQYYNGSHDDKLWKFLVKAYEIDPDRAETYDDMVTHYEIKGDKAKVKEFAEKWFASNEISSGIYAYNYNVLMSCEQNAILITVGDNDTYPAWILQNAKGIRTDISVLNASLLILDEYRTTKFKELGIAEFKPSNEARSGMAMMQEICDHIRNHSTRPFYYAGTSSPELYSNVSSDVYSVGLAYKYSKENFDNIALIRKNYENLFLLDHLKIQMSNDISQEVVNHASSNYLIPFLILYNHYKISDETNRLKEITVLIENIAGWNGQTEEVKKIMSQK